MFEANIGKTDSIARIALGMAFLAAGAYFGWITLLGIISIIIGAVFFVTGLIRFCLLYRLFGISTVEKKISHAPKKKVSKKKGKDNF